MEREDLFKRTKFWTTLMLAYVIFTLVMSAFGIMMMLFTKDPNMQKVGHMEIIISVIIGIVLLVGLIQARGNLVKRIVPAIWVYIAYLANQAYGIIMSLLKREEFEQARQQAEATGMSKNGITIILIVGYLITALIILPAIFALLNLRKLEAIDEDHQE